MSIGRGPAVKKRRVLPVAVLFLAVVVATAFAARGCLARELAESLVQADTVRKSDAIVVENLTDDYLPFEKAGRLQKARYAPLVLVLVEMSGEAGRPKHVSRRIAEIMCEVARVQDPEVIPVRYEEPITLGVARQVAEALRERGIESVIVATPGFRSRRTSIVYRSVLEPLGIEVCIVPVFGSRGVENWTESRHGIQQVGEQWFKLQYYRWMVLQ